MEQLVREFYSFKTVLLLACAVFYYKAADTEHASPVLWAGLSVLAFLVTWLVLGWGLLGCLGGQLVLFVGITLVKVLRSEKNGAKPQRGDRE